MRRNLIITTGILLLVILAVVFFGNTTKEGFDDTIMNNIQDRINPLASSQHPLTNPAADIGITNASGSSLRTISQAALNTHNYDSSGNETTFPMNTISPRIDNDKSFLALVDFCKETVESARSTGGSPFSNPKFAANCGVCMSSGKLVTGHSFNDPTGVVVYGEDQQIALETQKENKYKYPRAIPSLHSATCEGANRDDDSKPPTLAINDKMYQDIKNRDACKVQQWYGSSCGQCVSDSTSWSYVKTSSQGGGTYEIMFWLFGKGDVQVLIGGNALGAPQSLSMEPIVVNAGVVPEGTPFQIRVSAPPIPKEVNVANAANVTSAMTAANSAKIAANNLISLYAAIQSTLPNGKPFIMPIDNLIEIDEASGATPRRLSSRTFPEIELSLISFVPAVPFLGPNDIPKSAQMKLNGSIPLTFINPDQIAFYDCGAGPYTTLQKDGELLINRGDPCLNPASQGPDSYTKACLQSRIISSGCSTQGKWYSNGLPTSITSGKDLGQIDTLIGKQIKYKKGDPEFQTNCYGN